MLALVELMRNSGSDPVRVAAAKELLDRAHGKPKTESAIRRGREPAGDGARGIRAGRAMKEAIKAWKDDPPRFVRNVFGVRPDPWQDEVLAAFPKRRGSP